MFYFDLGVNIILNISDIMIIDFLCCKFLTMGSYKLFTTRNRELILVLLGLLCGTLANFSEINIGLYKLVINIVIIGLIISWKTYDFKETFIIYILISSLLFAIQFLIVTILKFLSINNLYIVALMTQTITFAIALFISNRINLWGVYVKILKDYVMQLLLSIAVVSTLIGVIFFEYNYSSGKIFLDIFWYICLVRIFLSIFILTIIKLTYYTKKLPRKYHEYENILTSIYNVTYYKME